MDVIGTTWPAAEGNQSLDLNALSNGRIVQTVTVVPGQAYSLGFLYAANVDGGLPRQKSFHVEVQGGQVGPRFDFDATGKTAQNMGWEKGEVRFTPTSSPITIAFASETGPSASGPALDGVTLGAPAKPKFVHIALGDSYQSGEGAATGIRPQAEYLTTGYENGRNYPGVVGDQENTLTAKVTGEDVTDARVGPGGNGCHRALMNYAKINRDKLAPGQDVVLIDRTCSGAKIEPSPEPGGKPPIVGETGQGVDPSSQVKQALKLLSDEGIRPDDVDLVTVGMGGNDAKFGEILQACVGPALLEAALRKYPNAPREVSWFVQQLSCERLDSRKVHSGQAILDLPPKVLDAQAVLLRTFETARILQLDYPNIVPTKDVPDWCGGLRGNDVSFASSRVQAINSVVRNAVIAAENPRLQLVEVQDVFGPNPLCPGGHRILANGLDQANFDTEVIRLLNLDGTGDAGARQRLDALVAAYNEAKACLRLTFFGAPFCNAVSAKDRVFVKVDELVAYLKDDADRIFGNLMSPPGTSDDTEDVGFDRSRGLFHPNAAGSSVQACAVLKVYQRQQDPASCNPWTASVPSTVNGNPLGNAPVDVSVGDKLQLVVEAFGPDSPVHLWLFSQPKDLGEVAADANGRVQTTVTVPDVNPGVHQLELQGEGVGGVQVTKQVLIRVAGRPSDAYTTYLCCFQPQPETVTADTVTETISVTVDGINIGNFPTDPDGGVLVPIPTVDRLRNAAPLVIEGTSSVTGKTVRELVDPIPTAPSLWATSTAADAISVTGEGFAADGRVHSEGGIRLRGAGHILSGGVEYGTVLDSAGAAMTITPAAVRAQAGQGGPAVPQMDQYRPGGAASRSGAPYTAVSKSDCVNGAWTPKAEMVLTGVVYVPCGLTLTRPGAYGATFAAEGPITVSGSKATVGQALPAGAGQPSLVTAATGADGIRITGADITLLGQALAPAGQVQVSGERVALGCGVVASRITVSGADSGARMSARCLAP